MLSKALWLVLALLAAMYVLVSANEFVQVALSAVASAKVDRYPWGEHVWRPWYNSDPLTFSFVMAAQAVILSTLLVQGVRAFYRKAWRQLHINTVYLLLTLVLLYVNAHLHF